MRVAIAGAGIGGLTAALALARRGIDVRVIEKTESFGEVGAGLQLSPNAARVLIGLGLGDKLAAVASEPQTLELRLGLTEIPIFAIPIRERAKALFGAPYYHALRPDLHGLLLGELDRTVPGAVMAGNGVRETRQAGDTVEITCEDGAGVEADVLIGADGIHSRVREILFGSQPARYTGNIAWRALVPAHKADRLPHGAVVWAGPGGHVVTYRVRRGEMVNVVAVRERDAPWVGESWMVPGHKEDLIADFEGWAGPVPSLLQAVDPASCFMWALHDRQPMDRWSEGRITLLGDACHPMLPFLAQGAAMAIEDAAVLATLLGGGPDDPASALQLYERLRKPRTAKVQARSRANQRLYHMYSTVAQIAVFGPMWIGARALPRFVNSRLDWVYAYDAEAEACAALQ